MDSEAHGFDEPDWLSIDEPALPAVDIFFFFLFFFFFFFSFFFFRVYARSLCGIYKTTKKEQGNGPLF